MVHSDGGRLEEIIRAHSLSNVVENVTATVGDRIGAQAEVLDALDDREWHSIFRGEKDLARLFALAPLAVATDVLLRDVRLNQADQYLLPHDRELLAILIEMHKKRIQDCEHSRSALQHEVLMQKHSQGELIRLSVDQLSREQRDEVMRAVKSRIEYAARAGMGAVVPDGVILDVLEERARDFVPGARAFLRSGGELFIGVDAQLGVTEDHRAYSKFLRSDFIAQVFSWFLVRGTAVPDLLAREMEVFQAMIEKM